MPSTTNTCIHVLGEPRREFGWPAPDDTFYEDLRAEPAHAKAA